MKNKLPQVVIIGRANVGKSTLFNRLIEKNKALVSKVAGTTRDRNIDVVSWRDREFNLIDTGGMDIDNKTTNIIDINIVKQAKEGIKGADVILFLVDAKAGPIPTDKALAREIIKQKLKSKTILIGNKVDNAKWRNNTGELYELNLGDPQMLSAVSGSGCGDMLDILIKKLPKKSTKENEGKTEREIKVAIVGKPNVGKSSLLNSILGEERVIVTDVAHTTRESNDTEFIYKEQKFILIDTAGIRRKNRRTNNMLEKISVEQSTKTIKEADVVLLITEAQKDIRVQDKKITQTILENSKSVIIVANKWDLIPQKDSNTINDYVKYYKIHFDYLWWAPIIFTSAKDNKNTKRILDLILEIKKARETTVSDSQLDKFLKYQIKRHKPSRGQGLKNPYIYEIKQTAINPPRFIIYVNDPKILHFSYIRFLQNNLREKFNIIGTPIQIETKKWK